MLMSLTISSEEEFIKPQSKQNREKKHRRLFELASIFQYTVNDYWETDTIPRVLVEPGE